MFKTVSGDQFIFLKINLSPVDVYDLLSGNTPSMWV